MAEAIPSLTREQLKGLLGTLPPPCPLEPTVIERVDLGEVVREKVRLQVEPDDWAMAYVLTPRGQTSAGPAMLCLHQHNGQFDLGKSEPAGLAGNPQQFYALELARRGYLTLSFDFICFEERRHPTLTGANYERFEFTRRLTEGSTLQAKMVTDAMRAVDYLVSRPEVDPLRIGCIGHSLGGQQTLFTAALDERIAAAVSSCGFASYASIFREAINHNFSAYVPGLSRQGDLGDILSLVAPRPFRIAAGTSDPIFPADGILDSVARAQRRYAALEAGDQLVLDAIDGGHAFTDGLRERAYTWLDEHLSRAF